jgi:multidrug transporter EmrE-like cation transporter
MPPSAPAYCFSFSGLSGAAETMSRNLLYAICAVFGVAIVVLGYMVYQDRQKPKGVEIKIDDNGISIQGN